MWGINYDNEAQPRQVPLDLGPHLKICLKPPKLHVVLMCFVTRMLNYLQYTFFDW